MVFVLVSVNDKYKYSKSFNNYVIDSVKSTFLMILYIFYFINKSHDN